MAKSRQRLVGKLLATASAATLGLLGIAGMAAAATPSEGTPPGNAPAGSTGSLTITKYAGDETDLPHNGTMQNDVPRPPLQGVTFAVCKVDGIDLTTDAGWVAAQGKTVANSTCAAGTTQSLQTDANGIAVFSGLPIGLYKVVETAAPAGVTPSVSFLVSIPYPSKSGSGENQTSTWLWDVYTYPKNDLSSDGSKTAGDPSANGLGATVPWTIKSKAIGSFGTGSITSFKLVDSMDANLTYAATQSLTYTTPGGTAVAVPAANYSVNVIDGQHVEVVFSSPDGVAWLNTLQAGTYFEWKLTTTVTGIGVLKNQAFQNDGGDNVKLGEATTDWGPAKLLKHDKGSENKVLKGAEFQVFNTNAGTCNAPLGAAITVSGVSTFASDIDGNVSIPGLYVGTDGNPATHDYCVVETKAPAGYVLDATPIKITVSPAALAEGSYSAKVPNTPTDGPHLPITGAQGTIAMTVGGLALIAVAGGLLAVNRRKQNR